MSMGVLYERLGEIEYFKERDKYDSASKEYFYSFKEEDKADRMFEDVKHYGEFHITALPEWNQRFVGVTANGIPIWCKKRMQYKYMGREICWHVRPREKNEVFLHAGQCETEEFQSFTSWRKVRRKKKLAFIYLGIFWMLEDGESLNDAAKRFIKAHQEVNKIFEERRNAGKYNGLREEVVYIYEIFRDGAIIFKDDKAIIERDKFFWSPSGLWAIAAAEGFFAKEGIKTVSAINNFYG